MTPNCALTLDALREALESAEPAMAEVRSHIERSWPQKPSLKVLDADSRALYKTATRLVEAGGGRFPSPWGALVTAIAAAYDTLDAFGHGDGSDAIDFSWRWNATGVDHDASPHPDVVAASALRKAITSAEASRRQICTLLDEIAAEAPPDAWLPKWTLDEARAYINAIGGPGRKKWQHSRPPQPPHRYTVRAWRPDLRQDFLAFAQLIQSSGQLKTWGGRVDAYLEVDGLEYWTMGARVLETTVINRAPVDAPGAAKPLTSLTPLQLRHAVEKALLNRRASTSGADTGILSERLRALLDDSVVR